MTVQNRTLSLDARKHTLAAYLDISSTTPLFEAIADRFCDIVIRSITLVYTVATDGGTRPETINVGTPSSATLYASITPAASTAINTVTVVTPSSSAVLPAGTALLIRRSAAAGGTNTGEVAVFVEYERLDTQGARN